MKKFTKIVLITCLITGVLGVVLSIVGIANYGLTNLEKAAEEGLFGLSPNNSWKIELQNKINALVEFEEAVEDAGEDESDSNTNEAEELWGSIFEEIPDSQYGVEEWEFDNLNEIAVLNIETEYSTVHIIESDEVDTVQVFGQKGSSDDVINASLNNGTLNIEEHCNSVLSSMDIDNSYVRVTVPTGMQFDEIIIDSDAGAVSYNLSAMCDDFQCEIDAGSFLAENILANNIDISVDAGNIQSKNCRFVGGVIKCDAGNIKLQEVTLESDIDVECNAGKVEIELNGQQSDYGFVLKCDLGSIKLDGEEYEGIGHEVSMNQQLDKVVRVQCDIGDVKITFTE